MARHHKNRTDPHCPKNINAADYSFVAVVCLWDAGRDGLGEALANQEARRAVELYRKQNGLKWSQHEHAGTCGVCGATARYVGVWHHHPTNTLIRAGEECSMNLDCQSDFRHLRKACKDAREYHTGKMRAAEVCKDHDVSDAWVWWLALRDRVYREHEPDQAAATRKKLDSLGALHWGDEEINYCPDCTTLTSDGRGWFYTGKGDCPNCDDGWLDRPRTTGNKVVVGYTWELDTILDLISKLVRYGSLSEKQWAFLGTLRDKVYRKAQIQAEREAEDARAEDCPKGRVELEGVVLTTKVQEGMYGDTLKMLVKDNRGFRVWGTVPAALMLVEVEIPCEHLSFEHWAQIHHTTVLTEAARKWREQDGLTTLCGLHANLATLARVDRKAYARLEWAYQDYTETPATHTVHRGLRKGDEVAFTATVTPKEGERIFGIYSRPSKARVVRAADTPVQ